MRKKVRAVLLAFFSAFLGTYSFLLILYFFMLRRIMAGWFEYGTAEVFSSIADAIPPLLFFIVFFLFLSFFYDYYKTALEEEDLLNRFSLAAFIQFLTFPLIVLGYRLIFSLEMMAVDKIIAFIGLTAAVVLFGIYLSTRKPEWQEPE